MGFTVGSCEFRSWLELARARIGRVITMVAKTKAAISRMYKNMLTGKESLVFMLWHPVELAI